MAALGLNLGYLLFQIFNFLIVMVLFAAGSVVVTHLPAEAKAKILADIATLF